LSCAEALRIACGVYLACSGQIAVDGWQVREEHFARPSDRCRPKAPAIICPIEGKAGRSRFVEAETFKD
jgi:hypothetical protein